MVANLGEIYVFFVIFYQIFGFKGDDADTTCAIFGQLAGAYYGVEGIPQDWREKIIFYPVFEALGRGLYAHSQALVENDSPHDGSLFDETLPNFEIEEESLSFDPQDRDLISLLQIMEDEVSVPFPYQTLFGSEEELWAFMEEKMAVVCERMGVEESGVTSALEIMKGDTDPEEMQPVLPGGISGNVVLRQYGTRFQILETLVERKNDSKGIFTFLKK